MSGQRNSFRKVTLGVPLFKNIKTNMFFFSLFGMFLISRKALDNHLFYLFSR
jgi:hypothetical protein